jgi:hypothetical protein
MSGARFHSRQVSPLSGLVAPTVPSWEPGWPVEDLGGSRSGLVVEVADDDQRCGVAVRVEEGVGDAADGDRLGCSPVPGVGRVAGLFPSVVGGEPAAGVADELGLEVADHQPDRLGRAGWEIQRKPSSLAAVSGLMRSRSLSATAARDRTTLLRASARSSLAHAGSTSSRSPSGSVWKIG